MRRFLIGTCVFSAFLVLVADSKGQTSPFPPWDWRNNYTVNDKGFVVVRPSPNARSSNCGAIAYSKSTRRYGYAWGKPTRADAERVALRGCNASDAFIAVHGTNTWLALASGSGESYGWGWSNASGARADRDRTHRVFQAALPVVSRSYFIQVRAQPALRAPHQTATSHPSHNQTRRRHNLTNTLCPILGFITRRCTTRMAPLGRS